MHVKINEKSICCSEYLEVDLGGTVLFEAVLQKEQMT